MATTMIERHYDDEALIALIENGRTDADPHLPGCPPCSEKIESFRLITEALCDQDVWDTRTVSADPVPATIANLRAFADRMADEDTRAEAILEELLTGSREEWLPRLMEHPEWRTAGLVRKLVDRVYDAVGSMPPDAVAMAGIATAMAGELESSDYPSDTIPRLCGSAWRANSYALFYTGNFSAADAAAAASQRHFDACFVNEYDSARLGIVKSLVLRPFERFAEAKEQAASSALIFEQYGDIEKMASARLAEVPLLVEQAMFAEAERLLVDLERQISSSCHIETHARILANLGHVHRKQGKVEPAIESYDCAAALFDEIGARTETVRIRWSTAVLLAESGRVNDACARLRDLMAEMEYLGMTNEAAVAGLDVAEFLLAQNRYAEVDEICRATMSTFQLAGLSYTARALTALAYIREAAAQRRADRALVQNVRNYIRELPRQPNLLFAPAPW